MTGRTIGARPSPAIVVAVLALVAAVAGTAVAGDGASTSVSKKKTKQIAKKQVNKLAPEIANQQITSRAPGLNVDKVDGFDANQISPAAHAQEDTDQPLTTEFTPVVSTNITTQGSTLLISLAVEAEGSGEVVCDINVVGTENSEGFTDDLTGEQTMSIVFGTQVGAGTHTVQGRCVGGSATIDDANINVSAHL
jgi:hypothetical protein